jgi:hypothetical protein
VPPLQRQYLGMDLTLGEELTYQLLCGLRLFLRRGVKEDVRAVM